jgi:hypothetical protein
MNKKTIKTETINIKSLKEQNIKMISNLQKSMKGVKKLC